MTENSNPLGKPSFTDCHWTLCRQFMERYRDQLPAEQLLALGHIFANTQLVLRGNADQTMALVLDMVRDKLPPATEVDLVENRCWDEGKAEAEIPAGVKVGDLSGDDAKVTAKQETEEVVEDSDSDCFEVDCSRDKIIEISSDEETDLVGQCIEKRTDLILPSVINSIPEPECPNAEINKTKPSETPKFNPIRPSSFASDVAKRREPITLDSVCRDLVLFDDDFFKTQTYYNRAGRGQLELTIQEGSDYRETHATIHVANLVLYQVTVKDRAKAMQSASTQFIQSMRDRCYSVKTLHPANALQRTSNIVQRRPFHGQSGYSMTAVEKVHYERIMRDFQAWDNGCHLVFGAEFTDLECNALQGIADRLKLPGRVYNLPADIGFRKRFLVLAKELPPQDIVRRIVTERDAELGFQYRVTAPQWKKNTSGLVSCEPKTKKKKVPETLTSLTKFAPVQTVRSVDDVYRNLVLIGTSFEKTAAEFVKTRVGMLQLSTSSECLKDKGPGGFNATVQVGKILLVQARNNTKKLAKFHAKAMFFKKAKMYCYQILMKQTALTEILVTKRDVPDSNNCKRFFVDFSKDCPERELVFSPEFSKADLETFISIATTLNLQVCSPGEDKNRRLRILGHRLPALAILERIVLARDEKLSAIYEVIPPKIKARRVE